MQAVPTPVSALAVMVSSQLGLWGYCLHRDQCFWRSCICAAGGNFLACNDPFETEKWTGFHIVVTHLFLSFSHSLNFFLIFSSHFLALCLFHRSFAYLTMTAFLSSLSSCPGHAWNGCIFKPAQQKKESVLPSLLSLYYPLPCAALHVGSQDDSGFKALLCLSFCKVNISLGSFSAFLCSHGRRVRMVRGLLGAVLSAVVSAANVHDAPSLGSSSGCAGPLNQSCVWRLRSPGG